MDLLFLIGLLIKTLEYLIADSLLDISDLKSSGRILWGVAFTLAIIKMIKIGIASKYFGPIILSINAMMKDVGMFLITFFVIMLAFSCGVSYMFNYLQVIFLSWNDSKVHLRTLRWPQAPARAAYSHISFGSCYRWCWHPGFPFFPFYCPIQLIYIWTSFCCCYVNIQIQKR